MKGLFFLTVVVLAILLAGCGGEISLNSTLPASHVDLSEGPLMVPISVRSTYDDLQTGHVFLDGIPAPDCLLLPQTTTICIVGVATEGIHDIVVNLDNGTKMATKFEWTPYSALDKAAVSWASAMGKNDPLSGYALMAGVLVVVAILVLSILGGMITKSAQGLATGGVIGFFAGMIILALTFFTADSEGGAITVAIIMAVIIALGLAAVIARGINYGRSTSLSHEGDKQEFVGMSFNGNPKVAQKAIGAGRAIGVASVESRRQLANPAQTRLIDVDD
jgi:hypothetical protein